MGVPETRTSNLHRQAGMAAQALISELAQGGSARTVTIEAGRLKEYLRSAYLRGYEDRMGEGRFRVSRFALQPTNSFPEGAPQRESYLSDPAYFDAEAKYEAEWRKEYECAGCGDYGCPQCGSDKP